MRPVRAAAVSAAMLICAWPAVAQPPSSQLSAIVTSGEAVVRRPADQAFVTAAVESRSKNPRDAGRESANVMTSVRRRLTDARIPNDAVRTVGYDIQQEFDFVNGRRNPRDYVARNTIEIRVDAIDRTGEIIDAVVQAGATSVAGVRFDLKDMAGTQREAVRLAVLDARARADAAAAGAGTTIDRVLRIEDVRESSPGPRPMMLFEKAADAQAPTPIESGLIEVRARVVLTASFK